MYICYILIEKDIKNLCFKNFCPLSILSCKRTDRKKISWLYASIRFNKIHSFYLFFSDETI